MSVGVGAGICFMFLRFSRQVPYPPHSPAPTSAPKPPGAPLNVHTRYLLLLGPPAISPDDTLFPHHLSTPAEPPESGSPPNPAPMDEPSASTPTKRPRQDGPEPDNTPAGPPRTKRQAVRKRAPLACEECRMRKRRCDGAVPACGGCTKRLSSCVYLAELQEKAWQHE
jgi:hypothetical protein